MVPGFSTDTPLVNGSTAFQDNLLNLTAFDSVFHFADLDNSHSYSNHHCLGNDLLLSFNSPPSLPNVSAVTPYQTELDNQFMNVFRHKNSDLLQRCLLTRNYAF